MCDLLLTGNSNIKTILTTNFDPLIQKRLSVLGKNFIQVVLDSDGSLGNISSNDPDDVKIVHLHGFWDKINTLHTQSQLKSPRPLLKSSLIDLLSDTTLLVIGYGGWDDIFIEALESATYESKIDVNVYWAFYESDHLKIADKNKKLFNKLIKFTTQGRFKAYSNIDCKDIFGDVLIKKEKVTPNPDLPMDFEGDIFSQVVEQHLYKVNNQTKIQKSPLKPYKLIHSKAHERIRIEERKTFIKWSGIENVIAINQGIGMGGENFLSSLINNNRDKFGDYDIYKVDLNGVQAIEDMNQRFLDEVGVSIEVFTMICSKKQYKSMLFIDGLSGINDIEWRNQFTRVVETLLGIGRNILIIPCGNIPNDNMGYRVIDLKSLNEFEMKVFLIDHVFGKERLLGNDIFHSIMSLTLGNPTKLDKVLDKLRFESIESIIRDEFQTSYSPDGNNVHFDEHLKILIDEILDTEIIGEELTELTKILSFLSKGETIESLNKFHFKRKLTHEHLNRLVEDSILHIKDPDPIFIQKNQGNVVYINPLASSYIKSKIKKEDANSIIKEFMTLYFGKDWFKGKPKLNAVIREALINDTTSGQSNAHIILTTFLGLNYNEELNRDIVRVINVALYLSRVLYNIGRYRDAIVFCEELITLLKNRPEAPLNRVYFVLSESYRLVSAREDAILNMEKVLENTVGLAESEIADAHLELALAYYKVGNKRKSIEHAKFAKKISVRGGAIDLHCQVIIASTLDDSIRTEQLEIIEKRARRKKLHAVANNIVLTFAGEETSNEIKIKLYDRVLSTAKNGYNFMRATIHRANVYKKMGKLNELTPIEKIQLCNLYGYLFTQRIHSLFDRLHDILWELFKSENNLSSLISLLRHSSVIWRLADDIKAEQNYLNDCKVHINKLNKAKDESLVIEYIESRLEDIDVILKIA